MERIFLGLTGASGHLYAERLVRALVAAGRGVELCATGAGRKVLRHELGVELPPPPFESRPRALRAWLGDEVAEAVRLYAEDAVEAPASSGTAGVRAVVLCPCSMGTLARVSVGFSSNLVERAADVALKERRCLILVPRETPLSAIHLENQLRLVRMGAVVLPAAPGFYHRPSSVADLVDHVVGKILDTLGIEHDVGARWTGELEPPHEAGIERPAATPSAAPETTKEGVKR